MASWLTANLIKEGHQVSLLSGEMTVEQRAAVIERYRNGKEKVLVTTNVCSRGGTDTEHHGRGQHVRWMFEANHKQLCTSGHFKESTWNKWHWWSTLTSQWIWKEMPTTRRTFIGLAAQDASARGDLLSIWWTASTAWILSNKLRCISVCSSSVLAYFKMIKSDHGDLRSNVSSFSFLRQENQETWQQQSGGNGKPVELNESQCTQMGSSYLKCYLSSSESLCLQIRLRARCEFH